VYEVAEVEAAVVDDRIGAVQVPLNVLDRRIDDALLDAALAAGTDVYVRSVLLQGVLAAPPEHLDPAIAALAPAVSAFHIAARELERSPVELAIGWVRRRPGVRGIVIGADSVGDLRALVAAHAAPPLTDDEAAVLAELPLPDAELCDPRRWAARS
jgi:aryl-alcohol dehydrogenase-like predicted oxidoreductase